MVGGKPRPDIAWRRNGVPLTGEPEALTSSHYTSSSSTFESTALYVALHTPGSVFLFRVNLAFMKCLKLVLFKSYCPISDILLFHSLWTNALIVSRFGRKRPLNALNVNTSHLQLYIEPTIAYFGQEFPSGLNLILSYLILSCSRLLVTVR